MKKTLKKSVAFLLAFSMIGTMYSFSASAATKSKKFFTDNVWCKPTLTNENYNANKQLESKDAYKYDKNGRQIGYEYVSYYEGKQNFANKSETSYDKYGRELQYVNYSYNDGKYVYTSKSVYSYPNDKTQVSTNYSYRDSQWTLESKSTVKVDSEGRTIEDKSEYMRDGSWRTDYLSKISYKTNKSIRESYSYDDASKKLYLSSKSENTEGSSPSSTGTYIYYSYDVSGKITSGNKHVQYRNDKGNLKKGISYNYDAATKKFVVAYTEEYTYKYNKDGSLNTETIMSKDSKGVYTYKTVRTYTYLKNGNTTYTYISYRYNPETKKFENESKNTNTTDVTKHTETYEYYNWENGAWKYSSGRKSTYLNKHYGQYQWYVLALPTAKKAGVRAYCCTCCGEAKKTETIKNTFTAGKLKYKVNGAGTVTFTGVSSKKLKSITVPATVKFKGITFKVTKIGAKAAYKLPKLTKVTIGKNVKSVGKNAFAQCKKLKTITFKGTACKTFGKKINAGDKKITVNVPKKATKTIKLLKKALVKPYKIVKK